MTKQYSSKDIKILEGLEPVRARPGMYIGNTGSRGLHHLIYEVIDNSIDEHLAGYCDTISIIINENGSITISDNGRGIPVDLHESGISSLRVILTTLHAGGKFDNDSYEFSGGLHGVGIAVVNALSSELEVNVFRDGNHYIDRYINGGKPETKLLKNGELPIEGKSEKTGTSITFLPDKSIFDSIKFKSETIIERLKEIAYLNKNLTITFIDNREENPEEIIFQENRGIVGFIEDINKDKTLINKDVIYFEHEVDGIYVEAALQYTNDNTETMYSFCNNINTQEGGTHVSGFRAALTRTINQYIRDLGSLKKKDDNLDGKDIRNGLTAILSIKHKDPQFEGQTKTKLGNSDARSSVDEAVSKKLTLYFDRNVKVLEDIIKNSIKSYNLRNAEAKARSNLLNQDKQISVSTKLAACQKKLNYKKDILTELYIVEGDSAGGSAKQGRDRSFQAILPLKGKPLNTERATISRILSNQEIIDIIAAIGTGFGDEISDDLDFDISKLNYDKIIIMTDADVDGSHIKTLLLTFFYRHMPELIMEGHVYIAHPPLYKFSYNKKDIYVYSDKELSDLTSKHKGKNFTIQRYKGLGEMNPQQLWETTMNPETRTLDKVQIDNNLTADNITEILMSSAVAPRREFIKKEAKNIDITI